MRSSSIAAVAYEAKLHALVVRFRSGGTCVYRDVPRAVFLAFKRATSAGRFFTRHIRGHFDFLELDPA